MTEQIHAVRDRRVLVMPPTPRDGVITRFHGIADPAKLASVASMLGVEIFRLQNRS